MLSDFPSQPATIKTRLFADDITIYYETRLPADATTILQPALNRIYRWGKRWELKFAPDKSTTLVFNRAYKPGADPLLFINGHRIPSRPKNKLLGVWFDQKLNWKTHISSVRNHCLNLKKIFSITANTKFGPPVKVLTLLFKTLVRSKIDYGLIAYGNASKSNLEKIDIVSRATLRLILGSKLFTPIQILYAKTGTEPLATRKSWLSTKYILKLAHNPHNSTYDVAKASYESTGNFPLRSTPCLHEQIQQIKRLVLKAFPPTPFQLTQYRFPPPNKPPPCKTLWFPLSKQAAIADKEATIALFNSLLSHLPAPSIDIYTDGSKSPTTNTTTCAVFSQALNIKTAWTLNNGSSVFTAELQGIKQALQIAFNLDHNPPAITIFRDSSSAIQAILSSELPGNEAIPDIRELIHKALDRESSSVPKNLSEEVHHHQILPSPHSMAPPQQSKNFDLPPQTTIRTPSSQLFLPHHEADPSCRYGCEAIENTEHILLNCPKNEPHRLKIRQLCLDNSLELNSETMLGLNTSLDTKTQLKIRDLLAIFRSKNGLIDIV
uniref:RNase H type-1 domain-containing protein n=1 Tax=Daphnia galeata TaxID=27404 RepID=A0A8J2S8G5_9CRUS|nr:unnamed protein product [Daphnia galeata]